MFEWEKKLNVAPESAEDPRTNSVQDSSNFSYALGEEFDKNGLFSWKIRLADFQKAWIGVARASDNLACDPETCDSKSCYIVFFSSQGTQGATIRGAHPESKQVFFEKFGDSSFPSGQTVEFLLNTLKSTLTMRIDNATARVAHNLDFSNTRPYICFQDSGSATLLENVSKIHLQSIITEEEWIAGCDNSLWPSDLDNAVTCYFGQTNQLGSFHVFFLEFPIS